MRPPSIRRTLLIRCGWGVGLLLVLLSSAIFLLVRHSLFQELDDSIRQTAAILANQVELENDHITYEWQEGIGTNRSLIEGALFQFWNEKEGRSTRSPGLQEMDLPRFTGDSGVPLMRGIRLADGNRARAVGLRIYPFVTPAEKIAMEERERVVDPKSLPQILVVARNSEPVHRALERLRWVLAGGGLLTAAIGVVLVDQAIRRSLRPIEQLSSQVQERAGHQLEEALDLPVDLPSELTGLAKNFDLLLGRVAAIRTRERDFIRHAAHELRTPIAGLRATTDLALSQSRDARAYAGYLETCHKTAIELGELVKRLSALARIGMPDSPASMERVDLVALLRERLQQFLPAAGKANLMVVDEMNEVSLLAKGDRALLLIIFNNLLDNAVSYSVPGSVIRVSAKRGTTGVELSLSNLTEEFPEDPERLFEPLFRREASRHDADAHLGIGLTLSLEAARAMGGDLRAQKGEEVNRIRLVLSLPAGSP